MKATESKKIKQALSELNTAFGDWNKISDQEEHIKKEKLETAKKTKKILECLQNQIKNF